MFVGTHFYPRFMRAWLVRLGCVGLRPLRRGGVPPAQRAAAVGWLGKVALGWGRGRWCAALGVAAALLGGLVLGTAAAIPLYQAVHRGLWDEGFETFDELWADLIDGHVTTYLPAILGHAALVLALALAGLIVWARLGARAVMARRDRCGRCRHTLTGLPLLDKAGQGSVEPGSAGPRSVRCPECGTLHPVLPAWGEVNAQTQRFVPATGLVRLFWTRRQVKTAAVTAAAMVALAGAVWAGQWAWSHIDARRQAAAAVAARLSPEEITRRIGEIRAKAQGEGAGRVATDKPTGMRASRQDLIRKLASETKALMDAFNADPATGASQLRQGVIFEENIASFDLSPSEIDEQAAIEPVAQRLLERLLAAGVERALDELAEAPLGQPALFTPIGAPQPPDGQIWGPMRVTSRLNLALLRVAVSAGDLAAVKRRLATAEALLEVSQQGSLVIDGLIDASLIQNLLNHIDWAARLPGGTGEAIVKSAEWFDALQSTAQRLSAPDIATLLEAERLNVLDFVAGHFSDPARVRRGLNDPSIADTDPMVAMVRSMLAPDTTADQPRIRLGGFQENVIAVDAVFDVLIEAARRPYWPTERYNPAVFERSELYFVRSVSSLPHFIKTADRISLSIQSVRIAIRIERFIALSPEGRPPTPEELPGVLGPDVDFTDPYTGKPLRYRITDLPADSSPHWPEHWPRRRYLLYAAGLDGTDDGGALTRYPIGFNRMPVTPGNDVMLPDGALSP